MTIRVLVADDQEIVRTGLAMIVDAQPGHRGRRPGGRRTRRRRSWRASFVPTSACSTSACRSWTASRRPVNSLDRMSTTRSPIVVITTFDLDEYVHGALKAGARGFLLKDAGPELARPSDPRGRQRRRPHRAERDRAAA